MNIQKDPNAKEGMRIRLDKMPDDPNPIPSGTEGTIILIDDAGVIHVKWDNGRRLGVIYGVDEYVLEPSLENVFDNLGENEIKKALKTKIKTSSPEIKLGKMTSGTNSTKSFKKANIKVESEEEDVDHMDGGGYAAAVGAYDAPAFGGGPLTKTGVAKPGPLHPQKKKVKENVFTKEQLINEITNSNEAGYYDDSNREPWADIDKDGWRWNDKPVYHKEGKIIDPLAKIKTSWDDSNLDISKNWDRHQNKLKKEDILRMVNNRLNESKKKEKYTIVNDKKLDSMKDNFTPPPIEEEEKIEETATFGSVFPGGNFPVVPPFAAKKGQWRTAKKPIWKGGKIVQRVENSGVLNPVNEANTVKYNPQGKIVKIKKKCTKFPYCSQGAVDKPLNVSNKVTEPGSYVEEQLMKNIHEVAKMTGKSFQEVYNIVKNEIFIK